MVEKLGSAGRRNRRKEILQGAERVIRTQGLASVTTRQISQEAGCSEGALYVHFNGRLELLLAMLEETLPTMLGPLEVLSQSIGRGSPLANLSKALEGIHRFHQHATPLVSGLFADPELHLKYRASLSSQGKGPHLSIKVLKNYIDAEQRMGRLDSTHNAQLAAELLMSASFFRAFSEQFFGIPLRPSWKAYHKQLLVAILPAAKGPKG